MSAPRSSLRATLLLLLLGTVLAAWLVTALLSYLDTRHEIDELFDAQLAQSAKLLLAQAAHDIEDLQSGHEGVAGEIASGDHKYERKLVFQVWDRQGRLLVRSSGAPRDPLDPAYLEAGPHKRSHEGRSGRFAEAERDGEAWRVFSHWDGAGEIAVQVGERRDIRRELAVHVAGRLLLPLAVGLPLLGLLAWLAVGRGLAPLRRVGREVAARHPGDLAPVPDTGVPAEVVPLVDAVNGLLVRVAAGLEKERRFTSDAAHELRTPLAALKTQAQVAQRTAEDATRRQALEQVMAGTDRATRLVEQLLALARLEPETGLRAEERADLAAAARQAAADCAAAALRRAVDLAVEAPGTLFVHGRAPLLEMLARNLVDNAVRYTPDGGQVRVTVAGGALTVEDSGPGIPSEERERVFDRFTRLPGSEAPGSGLGLSIVRRIAELHGARVTLGESPLGGLRVTVEFGS